MAQAREITAYVGPAGANGTNGTNGAGYGGTSTTSNAIASSGSKVFTTQTGLAYSPVSRVRVADSSAPATNWMEGVVTAYNSGTGSLTFTADKSAGSGTLTSWNLSIAGEPATGGGGTVNRLNYIESTDLHNPTALSATTWTDAFPNKNFTVTGTSSELEFYVGGKMQVAFTSVAGNCAVRLVVDSAGTPQNIVLGGDCDASAIATYFNPLAGANMRRLSGLSAGTHTIKLQIYVTHAATLYCQAATALDSLYCVVQERL